MNFGAKLRQLRRDRNLTQPELADAIGIEQSYLSKLETGKSLPSNAVFRRTLDVFALEVGDFVDDLDPSSRNQLLQLTDVVDYLARQRALIIGNRRRWLMGSAVLTAIGAALVYAGSANLFVSAAYYWYESPGVVLEGESADVFLRRTNPFNEASTELERRRDLENLRTRNFRGQQFAVAVKGGSRTYYYSRTESRDPWPNKAAATGGVFLLVLGTIGILLEKKLSRLH